MIKYFLIAFLAIQAVHGGVIKKTTIEEAFEQFLMIIKTHAWVATILFDRLEEAPAYRAYFIRDNAQRISVAAEITLQQTEEFFKANAEWGVVCFNGLQDQLAHAKGNLDTNIEMCISNSQVIIDQLIDETVSYKDAADTWVENLNATWINCNGNGVCQNDVLKQGKVDIEPFFAEFLVYKAKVDKVVNDLMTNESGELMVCVQSYYKIVFFDKLYDIVKRIPHCLLENKP